MKVIIENVEIKKRPKYIKKKDVEIPLAILWEHSEKVFTEDDEYHQTDGIFRNQK